MEKKNIIFFTPELSGYFYYNLEYFSDNFDVNITVFFYPYEKNAPYNLELSDNIIYHSLDKYSQNEVKEMAMSFKPDLVVIAGWNDRLFRDIGRVFKKKNVPVVMSSDNLWKSTLKQYVFKYIGHKFIKSFSDYVWLPGYPQYFYMRKMGFEDNEIILNYYNGNYLNKNEIGQHFIQKKQSYYPKTIVFVGRFVEYKQPYLLAKVFAEVQASFENNWKLILIGEGPLKDKIASIKNENIIIKSFMQPKELNEYIAQQGVFCLPSQNEHWGLVVHEAASVGLPMILSDSVGAATTFLINGYNGYMFKTNNYESLKEKLTLLMRKDDKELIEMSKKSIVLSRKITCDIWSSSLLSAINQ